jgi:hypothetical protein
MRWRASNDRSGRASASISACQEPQDVPPAIARLFSEEAGPYAVFFSTIHRAKGLEARRVWKVLDARRQPGDGLGAAAGCEPEYVGLTRKEFLGLVTVPDEGKGYYR